MARVSFESPYGQIRSEWSKGADGKVFGSLAEVPANTTSTVWLPAAEDAAVFESNLPMEKVAGIEYLGYKEGAARSTQSDREPIGSTCVRRDNDTGKV